MTSQPETSSVTDNQSHEGSGLTLEALAEAKKLPVELLQKHGCYNQKRNGVPAVAIPYSNEIGEIQAIRYRQSLRGPNRFRWRGDDHVMLYGLALLDDIRKQGWVLLVEGESDCWTAWHYGLPALGIPGKTTWRSEWAAYFAGLEVYLWVEPDAKDLVVRIAKDFPKLMVIFAPADKDGDDTP